MKFVGFLGFMLFTCTVGDYKVEETSFDFLIVGEEIKVSQRIVSDLATIVVIVDLDVVRMGQQIAIVEDVLKEWVDWAPVKGDTELATLFFGLTAEAAQGFVRITKLLNQIVTFIQPNPWIPETDCTFNYTGLTLAMATTDANTIKKMYDEIVKTWTTADIKADPIKKNVIKAFCNTLTEDLELWESKLSTMLNILDSLGSNIMPQQLMGLYQEGCIADNLGETVTVLDCLKTKIGYACKIEITHPMDILDMNLLIPVHYQDIRLRGETDHQQFAVLKETVEPKILDCDQYDFNDQTTPICEMKNVDKTCLQSLLISNVQNSIKNCNFTRETPTVGVRTYSRGILVQKKDTVTKTKEGTIERIVSSDVPIIIFSEKTVVLDHNGEKFDFAKEGQIVGTRVVKSRLTEEDIEDLEDRVKQEEFLENLDTEDILRYLLLTLQALSYPIIIMGIAIGMKLRRKVSALEFSSHKKVSKKNFKANQRSFRTTNV